MFRGKWVGAFALLLLSLLGCSKNQPADQAGQLLANPYNPKVKGNIYKSNWKDFEVRFNARRWRVEKGEYALHLVARDKYSQAIFGSRYKPLRMGSLPKLARNVLKDLGMREPDVISEGPAQVAGREGLELIAEGRFRIDYYQDFEVPRKVKVVVTKKSNRFFWIAYITQEEVFEQNLSAFEQLRDSYFILSEQESRLRGSLRRDVHEQVSLALPTASQLRE